MTEIPDTSPSYLTTNQSEERDAYESIILLFYGPLKLGKEKKPKKFIEAAAAGPGVALSPKELLPKGDAEKPEEELEEEDDEELDETLSERLWGLMEMLSERVQSAVGATFDLSLFVAQKMYRFSRAALWIGTTSLMILVFRVVFGTEKFQLKQRQILLGPNSGLSGGMPGALPSLPGKN
ncbi:mitochondrial import receptor subunit TOM22 homolog [Mesoplodon densirostris]|uniref:mitochondrial import receptor subunit TOM22 homolog n=1 Tax=Mesoplodon densirostris TaxID=48708 RepID=UPI0028DC3EBD|nr:mitochondrial import receptor subunit TOM22 homolog [Mesoplodon densirostris]